MISGLRRDRFPAAGIDAVYTDAATMLREADIDAVDICADHDWHRDLAVAAAESGKHVLLEKPMANTMQQYRDIIAATDKAGGRVGGPRSSRSLR